jgi:Rod binding domain-containing protein
MNIAKTNTQASAATRNPIPLEQLAGNKTLSKSEKLAEASRQFESMLLRQILSSARKTVIKSKVTEDSLSSGVYQDMVNDQLADSISRSGGFGLARGLATQLQAAFDPESTSNPSPQKKIQP